VWQVLGKIGKLNVLKGYFSFVPYHFAALMHTCIVPGEKVLFIVLKPLWVCY